MSEATAVRVAIDLLRVPSRARLIREAPLPDGMELLLRIAAGEREAIESAMAQTERSEPVLRQAAEFFIEQIMLSPLAGSYRVLGANPDAPGTELRRNMALLVRWMHPDVARTVDRAQFAGRVTLAWDDLKTAERRTNYDRSNGGDPASRVAASPALKAAARKSKLRRLSLEAAQHAGGRRRDLQLIEGGKTMPGFAHRLWLLLLRRAKG